MQIDPYAATNALSDGFNQQQMIAQGRARRVAGNALASGNTAGAMSALGGAGDLQSQRVLQSDMTAEADAMREREAAERTEKLRFILQGAEGLLQAPPDQRREIYTSTLRPVLEQMGYPPEVLAQLDDADMSDAQLRSLVTAVGGEVGAVTANDRMSGGNVIRPDRYTGEYATVYDAPAAAPNIPTGWMLNEDGSIQPRPGLIEGQGRLAAAGRAPPRPRSGNSGVNGSARPGSGGQAAPAAGQGLPSGFTVRRR
jgi:hypothetical protein